AIVAKGLVVAALVGGGAAGVKAVSDSSGGHPSHAPKPPAGTPAAPASTSATATPEASPSTTATPRRRGHTDRGKEFAKTRGKGKERGLLGTQPGKDAPTAPGRSGAA